MAKKFIKVFSNDITREEYRYVNVDRIITIKKRPDAFLVYYHDGEGTEVFGIIDRETFEDLTGEYS